MDEKAMLDELAAQMEEHPNVKFLLEKEDGQAVALDITDVTFTDGAVQVKFALSYTFGD